MFSLASDFEQLPLTERISSVRQLANSKPQELLNLLNTHIDLPTLVPHSFRKAYYASATNDREYSLESILAILLLLHIFKVQSPSCFLTVMHFSPMLQEFCQLPEGRVPVDSVLSNFKIAFEDELRLFFDSLALKVMGIFDEYDAALPEDSPEKGLNGIAIYDPTGLKPKVKENNPKTLETEIKRQSNYKKHLKSKGQDKDFNVYLAAWKNMPKHAKANDAIRLGYANGHFGYFYKYGLLTNGFGIPLHIHFFDKNFYDTLPGDFDSPQDQKYACENASLAPVFKSFYANVGPGRFHTFLGDSECDSYDNFALLNTLGFSKILIPLNSRATPPSNHPIPRNHEGIPCCPKDGVTRFIYRGQCKGKNRSLRFKFVCPLSRNVKNKWISFCDNKCRPTNSTVTSFTYPSQDLRTFPGILRGSDQWKKLYKKRTIVEREISSMKSHPALERPNTYNCASLRADVYLNASAKLLTVMLAFALGKPSYMRNLKNLLLAA